ncbi:MAG: molybdate ABC transporter substrate-binding protein [Anaerolineales bacterium]
MRKVRWGQNLSVMVLITMLALASCQQAAKDGLSIAAAASLNPVFQVLADRYEQVSGETITVSFSSTGALAEQLRNGGPFDVFAAADAEHIDQLIQEGVLSAPTRTVFGYGQLVLLVSPDFNREIRSSDQLLDARVRRIAIANPDYAPYGVAARQYLEHFGLWHQLQAKIIYAETVRQAAVFVQTGNADAGLVARSVVTPGEDVFLLLPETSYAPIEHVAAVRSESPHASAAMGFLEYLLTPDTTSLLEQYGFSTAAGSQP